jgi:hypothetical protein
LIAVAAILIALGTSLSDRLTRSFEVAAGVMLVILGIDVLRRLRQRRIHFHAHRHADGVRHLHAHAHAEAVHPEPSAHEHEHGRALLARSLAVGSIHGLAGSGALVLLSMQMVGSGAHALAYVVAFAIGSILGMVAFSLVLSLPLTLSPRLLERVAWRLEAGLGVVTIAIGCWTAVRAAAS